MPGEPLASRLEVKLEGCLVSKEITLGTLFFGATDWELIRRAPQLLWLCKKALDPLSGGLRVIAAVDFTMWTTSNTLRAPSYKGLRDDIPPTEVRGPAEDP